MAIRTTKNKNTKKKATKRTVAAKQNYEDVFEPTSLSVPENTSSIMPRPRNRQVLLGIGVLIAVIVIAVLWRNRNWVLAATVNGQPIFSWQLNQRLSNRYGNQVLEAMIGEQLITEAAAKENVVVSQTELDARISEIEKSLGSSMSLDDALKMQGVSKDEFNNQVRVQLLIDKLLAKEVTVSAEEVDAFIASNAAALTATEPAAQRQQAQEQLKNSKLAEKFQEWFTKIKEAAKINRYL